MQVQKAEGKSIYSIHKFATGELQSIIYKKRAKIGSSQPCFLGRITSVAFCELYRPRTRFFNFRVEGRVPIRVLKFVEDPFFQAKAQTKQQNEWGAWTLGVIKFHDT